MIPRGVRGHAWVGFGQPVAPANPMVHTVYSRGEALLDLVLECRPTTRSVAIKGRAVALNPDEVVLGLSALAGRWNWTVQQVRIFLARLEAEGIVARVNKDGAAASAGSRTNMNAVVKVVKDPSVYATEAPQLRRAPVSASPQRREPKRKPVALPTRLDILRKTSGRCAYCGTVLTLDDGKPNTYHADHVLPVTLGGSDDIANLVASCRTCNLEKSAKTALQFLAGGAP